QKVPDPNGYPNYPQMGRLNCLLRFPDATDMSKDVLFVGAPAGGIWKSTDGGANWTPILDNISGIGITDIQSASTTYSNTTVIYVSTGDWDGNHVNSIGVLKSTDGGNTFVSTGLSTGLSEKETTSNLIVLDDKTVIVGTTYHVMKSTDGGDNWSSKLTDGYDNKYGRFTFSNDILCCTGIWGGVYKSINKGDSWSILKPEGEDLNKHALFSEDGFLDIIDMTGQLSYIDLESDDNLEVYGNKIPTYEPQGGYNQTLVLEGDLIISGGMNGFHSNDEGETWYRSLNGYWDDNSSHGTYIHSDHHTMGKLDDDGSTYKYWSCNDGGLNYIEYSSDNDNKPKITYKSEGCIVTQLYSVAITPNSTSGNMLQGNQDNDGFSREMHNGKMQWIAAAAGDGTATAIDYNDPDIRYLGGTYGGLTIVENGFSGKYNGDEYIEIPGASFIWPLEMNTQDSYKLYAGGDDVYLLDEYLNLTPLNANTGEVSFISTHNNGIFAIGWDGIKKSLDGGNLWSDIVEPSSNASASLNSIDFNGTNPNYVYATSSSYVDGDKVFKSVDGGQNWSNISGSLPNILMKEVLVLQNNSTEVLFVATELGVYQKDGDKEWVRLGGSTLPNVIVNDIDVNYTEKALIAGTYGRGLWQIDISSSLANEENILNNNNLSVYPNPATSNHINLDVLNFDKNKNYSYIIHNVVGGIILEGKINSENTKIDISTISNGAYILQVRGNNNVMYSKKIIKN
ncbi:MAG: T9SS type A sorting domain-containing protein, partial [Flavobacteriales bacterium]|nr:T9SS type A sorting domain-containing protein [Flavobacteriales bacterium]